MGYKIRDHIIKTMQMDILLRVNQDVCYDTKLNEMSVLADISEVCTSMENGSELLDPVQPGTVPSLIVFGMITIGKVLSDAEIDQIVAERG